MKTILLIGEHHDYNAAKLLIAQNAVDFAKCNFLNMFFENITPEEILRMGRRPEDKNNLFESYEAVYKQCKLAGMNMRKSEDISAHQRAQTDPRFYWRKRSSFFERFIKKR